MMHHKPLGQSFNGASPCPGRQGKHLHTTAENFLEPPEHSPKFRGALHRIWKYLEPSTTARVFAAAFMVSILCGFAASYVSRTIIGGEGHDGYLELAQNLVAGKGYVFTPGGHKVFHRPPAYPVLLIPGAVLPKQFCNAYIILLNSALFAGSVAVLFSFGAQLFNRRLAAASAAFLLLNPFLLYGIKNPMSAFCQMFFYLLVIVATWRISQSNRASLSHVFFFVIVLWAAVMSHGVLLAIAVVVLGSLAIRAFLAKRGPTLFQTLVIAGGLALLIAPWTWRNYRVTGLFIPVAGNSGLAYFAGNAHWGITQPPRRLDEYREDSEFRHARLPLEKRREWMNYYGFTNAEAEKLANQRALEHMRTHPVDFLKKFVLNGLEYYFPMTFAIFPPQGSYLDGFNLIERIKRMHGETVPLSLYHLALVLSAIFGFLHLRPSHRNLAFFLLAAWWLYAILYFPFLTFVGHSLYTYGTLPILSLLAAAFWVDRRAVNPNH